MDLFHLVIHSVAACAGDVAAITEDRHRREGAPTRSDASSRGWIDEGASPTESLERYIDPLYYILRQVRQIEGAGRIYRGALSTPALVNETILSALQNMQKRSPEVPLYSWLRRLARDIIEREVTRVQEEEHHETSLEASVPKRMRPLPDQPLVRSHYNRRPAQPEGAEAMDGVREPPVAGFPLLHARRAAGSLARAVPALGSG